MERPANIRPRTSKTMKQNRIVDLYIQRSIGAITSGEYKRRTILNELSHVNLDLNKSSVPTLGRRLNSQISPFIPDDILGMEVDPKLSRCLLTITRYNRAAIYNISQDVKTFDQLTQMIIPHHDPIDYFGIPNSVHWLWDGTVFTIGTMDSILFWDAVTLKILESVKTRTRALNHVIAAKKDSVKKYVAVSGLKGRVYMLDMHHGICVLTMQNADCKAVRAIHWHPTNEFQYITGNDNGDIFLWDIRNRRRFVKRFCTSGSFYSCHSHPIIGIRFYNYGNSVISVDKMGIIKTWEVSTGHMRPNHYDPVKFCAHNKNNIFKEYQFDVTGNLEQDVAFLPSNDGMRILNIDTGKHFRHPNSISIPTNCAAYDPKNYCVYGSYNDQVKVWSPNTNYLNDIELSL